MGAGRNARFDAIIQSSNQLIDLFPQSKAKSWSIRAERKAGVVALIARTAILIEGLKVARNKETELIVVLDLLVVENGVDGRLGVSEELIGAGAMDIFACLRELDGTSAFGIGKFWTPLLTLGREKTSISDPSEVCIVSANLEQKHVGFGRNLIELDVTLILDAVGLIKVGARTRLEVEVLGLFIRDPSIVLAELHGVGVIDPHAIVLIAVVVGATEDFIRHAALCSSQLNPVS